MDKIYSGKTVEEAVAKAANELGIRPEEVSYTVEEMGNKGFFGIGFKPARINVVFEVSLEDQVKEYLDGLYKVMDLSGISTDIEVEDDHVTIQITGEEADVFMHRQGDAVEGLQHLVAMTLNKESGHYYKVTLNVNDYREKTKERLEALAMKTAKQVYKTRKRVTLPPMTAFQRRIIHSKLQDVENISTYSVGEEPNRKVVVSYQNTDRRNSKGNGKYGNKNSYGKKPYNKNTNDLKPETVAETPSEESSAE